MRAIIGAAEDHTVFPLALYNVFEDLQEAALKRGTPLEVFIRDLLVSQFLEKSS